VLNDSQSCLCALGAPVLQSLDLGINRQSSTLLLETMPFWLDGSSTRNKTVLAILSFQFFSYASSDSLSESLSKSTIRLARSAKILFLSTGLIASKKFLYCDLINLVGRPSIVSFLFQFFETEAVQARIGHPVSNQISPEQLQPLFSTTYLFAPITFNRFENPFDLSFELTVGLWIGSVVLHNLVGVFGNANFFCFELLKKK
jgi:hypothetical protein